MGKWKRRRKFFQVQNASMHYRSEFYSLRNATPSRGVFIKTKNVTMPRVGVLDKDGNVTRLHHSVHIESPLANVWADGTLEWNGGACVRSVIRCDNKVTKRVFLQLFQASPKNNTPACARQLTRSLSEDFFRIHLSFFFVFSAKVVAGIP